MKNTLENYEKNHISELMTQKSYPSFGPGDTIKVHLKVKEGEKERIQIFEGVCIAKKNAAINSSFTVRKISYGEGIERVLPLYSPQITKIELAKRGDVRRSKLYYLRSRSGKSARITEKSSLNNESIKSPEVKNEDKKQDTSSNKSSSQTLEKTTVQDEPSDHNDKKSEAKEDKK